MTVAERGQTHVTYLGARGHSQHTESLCYVVDMYFLSSIKKFEGENKEEMLSYLVCTLGHCWKKDTFFVTARSKEKCIHGNSFHLGCGKFHLQVSHRGELLLSY